ncbi:WSC domain-containing protein [Lactarius quietus]|nr:WSC domain-containing protein [Lactarius quietus]
MNRPHLAKFQVSESLLLKHTMHSTRFLLSSFQVAVTVLLAIAPVTSAIPSPSRTYHSPKELHFRNTPVQHRDVLPTGMSLLGCYTYNPSAPALTSEGYTDLISMTVDNCVEICQNSNHAYAGLENGTNCYCGNVLTQGTVLASSGENCSTNCVGDPSEICGGNGFLSLYGNEGPPPPQPTLAYSVPDAVSWELAACYNDSNTARALSVQVSVRGGAFNNTVGNCIDACAAKNYHVAGVEFAQECWCGNSINNGAIAIDTDQCTLACSGDSTEFCGGADAFLLYLDASV